MYPFDNKMILMYSSCYRPLYKQDNYNILAYPPHFKMYFRYRKKHVDEDIWENPQILKGNEALIIIIAETNNFFPVRKVKITHCEKNANTLYVYFELLNLWVDYDDSTFLKIRNHIKKQQQESNKFIINAKYERIQYLGSTGWETIISKLAKKNTFSNTIFYEFKSMKDLETEEVLKIIDIDNSSGFNLKAGKSYGIEISFDFGKEPPHEVGKFEIFSPDSFITPSPIQLGFRVDKKIFTLVTPHNVISDLRRPLILKIINSDSDNNNLEGPFLEIPLKISKGTATYAYFAMTIIGFLFMSGFITSLINIVYSNPTLDIILRTAGLVLTSLGFWYFRGM